MTIKFDADGSVSASQHAIGREQWTALIRERDELRAEIERLKEALHGADWAGMALVRENESLREGGRVISDHWYQAALAKIRERDELRATLERHNAEFREQIQAEHAAYQELVREIERLRAALEKIADSASPYSETHRRIAHDALARPNDSSI